MTQYKDTTERIKRPQRVKKGQNAPIFFTFLMDMTKCGGIFAGLVATIGYLSQCHTVPANAKSTRGVFTTPQTMLENIKTTQPNKNSLPLVAGVHDNKDLSKTNSGQASRYPLAFFMPNNRPTSQVDDTKGINPHLTQFTGLNRHINLPPSPMKEAITSYGGVTLQNTKAIRRICRAVTVSTESEPRHPMPVSTVHSVVITQNLTGGHNHA